MAGRKAKPEIPAPAWAPVPKAKKPPPPPKPPPSAASANHEPARAAPSTLIDLGSPPVDSLAVPGYVIKFLCALMEEMRTESMSPSRRRAEALKLAAGIAKQREIDRLYQAKKMIEDDRAQLESTDDDPEMEPAPDDDADEVDGIGDDGTVAH